MKTIFSNVEMMIAVFLLLRLTPLDKYTRSGIRTFLCMPEQKRAADDVLDELLSLELIHYHGAFLEIEDSRQFLLMAWEDRRYTGFSREELQWYASGMLNNWISWKAINATPSDEGFVGFGEGIQIFYILTDMIRDIPKLKGLYLTGRWLSGTERYGFLPAPPDYYDAIEQVYDFNMNLKYGTAADCGCIFGLESHPVELDGASDLVRLYPNIQGPVLLVKLHLKGGFQFVLYEINTRAMTLVWEVPRMTTWKVAEKEAVLDLEVICSEAPAKEDHYDLLIPSEIMGFTVRKLPSYFQRARTRCRKLVIPGSVKEIQDEALGSCYLRELILQDSASSLIGAGFGVFGGMRMLKVLLLYRKLEEGEVAI